MDQTGPEAKLLDFNPDSTDPCLACILYTVRSLLCTKCATLPFEVNLHNYFVALAPSCWEKTWANCCPKKCRQEYFETPILKRANHHPPRKVPLFLDSEFFRKRDKQLFLQFNKKRDLLLIYWMILRMLGFSWMSCHLWDTQTRRYFGASYRLDRCHTT